MSESETGRGDYTASTESRSDSYNGWTNRETWAVALHINNDQGWQESVHEALRLSDLTCGPGASVAEAWEANRDAGEIIRESVEETLDMLSEGDLPLYRMVRGEIGSFWRVDWTELGAAFLSDLEEQS